MATKLKLIVKEDSSVVTSVHYKCDGDEQSVCIMDRRQTSRNWHGHAIVHFIFTTWLARQRRGSDPLLHERASTLMEWFKKASRDKYSHSALRSCLQKEKQPVFHLRITAEIKLELWRADQITEISDVGNAEALMERVMRQLPPAKGWLPRYGLGPATDAITLPQVEVLGSTKAFYRALDIAVQQARYEVCLTNFSLTGLHWESFEAPRQGDATLPKPSELLSAPEADSVESYARSIAKAIDNRAKEDDRGLDIRRMVTILSRSKYEHVWSECCKYEDRARFQCRVLDVSSLYEENDLKMLARLAHNFRGDVPAPKVPYPMNLQLIDHEIAIITRPALGYQTLKEEGTSLLFRGQDVVRPLKDFYNRLWEQLPALKDGRKVHVNMFSALADGLGMEKSLGALTNELEARRGAAALCD